MDTLERQRTVRLDWCSHAAAKYAVEHWHYSRQLPKQKLVKIGVWEASRFTGVIVFGDSANKNLLRPYGLSYTDGCELVRVALTTHTTPVSRLLAISLGMVHTSFPRLRLVVSFADPDQGHLGQIYQAGNWIYTGRTAASDEYLVLGQRFQGRALRSTRASHPLRNLPATNVLEWAQKVLDPCAQRVKGSSKYRYLFPLDAAMRRHILPLAQPYPKRARSIQDAPVDHTGEGEAASTLALCPNRKRDCSETSRQS